MGVGRIYLKTMVTSQVIAALAMVSGIVTARALGPEGRGDLAVVLLWPSIISSLSYFGTLEAIGYLIAKDQQRAPHVIGWGMLITTILGIICAAVSYFVLPHLLRPNQQHLLPISRLFLLMIPAWYLTVVVYTSYSGRLNYGTFNLLRVVHPATYCLSTLILFAAHSVTVLHLVIANLAGHAMAVTLSVARLSMDRPKPRLDSMQTAGTIFRTGLAFYTASLAGMAVGRLDQVVLARGLPAAEIGMYAVALSVAGSQNTLTNALGHVATTLVASSKNLEVAGSVLVQQFRTGWTFSLLISMLGAALCPLAIPLLYTKSFQGAVLLSWILLPAVAALSLSSLLGLGLRGMGRPFASPVTTLANGAVFACLVWPLLRFRAPGVAAALAISSVCALVGLVSWSSRITGIPFSQFWKPDLHLIRAGFAEVARRLRRENAASLAVSVPLDPTPLPVKPERSAE